MADDQPRALGVGALSDEELDQYILARLTMAGVDLSVLPEDDPGAPADRARILRSARDFLRQAVSDISRLELDPDEAPPELYPASFYPSLATRAHDGAEE